MKKNNSVEITPTDESEIDSIENIQVQFKCIDIYIGQRSGRRFDCLKNDDERVFFTLHLLKTYDLLNFDVIKSLKDETIASKYRTDGNQCYKMKQFMDAMKNYNQCIANAPTDSETLAFAYGNRSAVLFTMKRYDACIQNIVLALKENFPEQSKCKLLERQRKCEELLNNNYKTKINFDPKLSYGSKPDIPCASSAVSMKYNNKYGRHVVAARDIKCGDVLGIETPFCTLLLPCKNYINCTNCLQKSLTMIPCLNCCEVMFCDEKCRQEAFNKFHNIECPILPTLTAMKITKEQHSGLRVAAVALNKHGEGLKMLINDIESNCDPKELDFTKIIGGHRMYDTSNYAPIHMLTTNTDKRRLSDQMNHSIAAAIIFYLLKKTTKIRDIRMFCGLIYKHIMTSCCSITYISNIRDEDLDRGDHIAFGSFAFHNMFNHSCAPSIQRESFFVDGQVHMISYAVTPIAKGQQIWDGYGCHYTVVPKPTRHSMLMSQWLFNCECIACKQNYPLGWLLQPIPNIPTEIVHGFDTAMLHVGNAEHALKILPELIKQLEQLINKKPYPSIQLFNIQATIRKCYAVLCYQPYF